MENADILVSRDVLADMLNAPPDVQKAFTDTIKRFLAHLKPFETMDIHYWIPQHRVYITVVDTRYKHYPCGHRALVSFDIETGHLYDTNSRYAYARNGWKKFMNELLGTKVLHYDECGDRDKTTTC